MRSRGRCRFASRAANFPPLLDWAARADSSCSVEDINSSRASRRPRACEAAARNGGHPRARARRRNVSRFTAQATRNRAQTCSAQASEVDLSRTPCPTLARRPCCVWTTTAGYCAGTASPSKLLARHCPVRLGALVKRAPVAPPRERTKQGKTNFRNVVTCARRGCHCRVAARCRRLDPRACMTAQFDSLARAGV
jgi:hypothetical protein